jgi:hypothetical protein
MVELRIGVIAAQRNMVEYDVGRSCGCEAKEDNRRLHIVYCLLSKGIGWILSLGIKVKVRKVFVVVVEGVTG